MIPDDTASAEPTQVGPTTEALFVSAAASSLGESDGIEFWLFVPAGMVHAEETPDGAVGDFLYARDGGGGTTTYVEDDGSAEL